jgi:hypothetical protein
MANAGHDMELMRKPSHDGALRCVLCAGAGTVEGHDWCTAAECIVCEGCCGALIDGDIDRLVSIAANSGLFVTPDALARSCMVCARAQRHVAERVLDEELEGADPC